MTHVVLIRHGQADYSCLRNRNFPVICAGYAPLTQKGVMQAEAVADDQRLNGSELIVSSPYTRALQTAAVISRKTGLVIDVQFDLHEWLPDVGFNIKDESEFDAALKSFREHDGIIDDSFDKWEPITEMRKRTFACLAKFSDYNKIIVVTHEFVMYSLTGIKDISNCGIIEINL